MIERDFIDGGRCQGGLQTKARGDFETIASFALQRVNLSQSKMGKELHIIIESSRGDIISRCEYYEVLERETGAYGLRANGDLRDKRLRPNPTSISIE